ncbi:unnamed protein product [Kuraishia capsulata CBS 1993]|uniref:Uncharacterized protein n=1 Tax=Kuraishia capsulata CBS 1993 TaxID=1382522 RepID=W6MHM5_9ASCO|nr:uncharacterized protein KUCA_T00001230001 [Kuraishia capsulata CBS 1993]CDK25263.1 unnamed protein product [Kuraishia capsulata CBS 1993]
MTSLTRNQSLKESLTSGKRFSKKPVRKAPGIDSTEYDPMDDVLLLFDSPSSLGELDQLITHTNRYKSQLEDAISKNNQEYQEFIKSNENSDTSLSLLETQLVGLIKEFDETKFLAESTGSTINSMTSNIKTLDNCKKNLTLSMTILKRLQMLITAYESLVELINDKNVPNKNYREISQLLSVVLDLMQHFQSYKSIDDISVLNKRIGSLRNKIIDEIFNDFEKESDGDLRNPDLVNACLILDMLGKAYHDKLSNWYVTKQLREITTIFKSTEEAGSLDNLKRRFIFFQRILSNFEQSHTQMFPEDWHMSLELTSKFCDLTKKDLKEVTDKETRLNGSNGNRVDVNLLLKALSDTLEFESFLNQKFKYYGDFDQRKAVEEANGGIDPKLRFDQRISSVFEPYLNIWIDHQSKVLDDKFVEFVNPANHLKRSGNQDSPDEATSLNVLDSSAELFRVYRQMLNQLSKLSQGEPLVRLSSIFVKYLIYYQQRILEPILPDTKRISSSTEEANAESISYICLVLNTADYCSLTVSQLEEKLASIIKPPELAQKFSFETVKDSYLSLVNNCLNLLLFKVQNDMEFAWREMRNENWKVLSDVTGESRYVSTLKTLLIDNCSIIFPGFNRELYIRNFVDKTVEMVLVQFTENICRLRPVNEIMAEQFLLDLQTLRGMFLELPNLAPDQRSPTNTKPISKSQLFHKFITQTVGKPETLLKVLMTRLKPIDSFVRNYFIIVGDQNFSNFYKVLQLKGAVNSSLQSDQKQRLKYLDEFKSQLLDYTSEKTEESPRPLEESYSFLENLDVDAVQTGPASMGSPKSQPSAGFASPSPQSALTFPNLFASTSNSPSPVGNSINNLGIKIDKQSLLNTKGQLEKNFAKTFSGDNKLNINENFKNFGKFFGKKN